MKYATPIKFALGLMWVSTFVMASDKPSVHMAGLEASLLILGALSLYLSACQPPIERDPRFERYLRDFQWIASDCMRHGMDRDEDMARFISHKLSRLAKMEQLEQASKPTNITYRPHHVFGVESLEAGAVESSLVEAINNRTK